MKDLRDRTALLVRFGYDGASFYGLQPQPGLPTAGGALAARLAEAAGRPAKGLAFSARTDRGVHADHNLATCYFRGKDGAIDVDGLLAALVRPRTDGLRFVEARVVPPTVHARGISRGKHYRYRLLDGVEEEEAVARVDAGRDRDVWCIAPSLDVTRAQAAADALRGRHDFSSFRGGGCTAKDVEKTLFRADVTRVGPYVHVDLVGDAFLRKMVRNIVGLLAEVGTGWRPADDVPRVLAARQRNEAGLCAPPEGLTLVAVGCAWPEDGSWLLPECPKDLRDADEG